MTDSVFNSHKKKTHLNRENDSIILEIDVFNTLSNYIGKQMVSV